VDHIEKTRQNQLERCVQDIWDFSSYLYIGAGEYRHHFFEVMEKKQLKVDVVEIDMNNYDWLDDNHQWLHEIYHSDIKDFITTSLGIAKPGESRLRDEEFRLYDVILWSHGVETISKKEGELTLKRLEKISSKLIIHMTPFGSAGGTGNVSSWYPGDFEKLGYETDTLGQENERNSNLLAWKYV
jgi:hypothetical protein